MKSQKPRSTRSSPPRARSSCLDVAGAAAAQVRHGHDGRPRHRRPARARARRHGDDSQRGDRPVWTAMAGSNGRFSVPMLPPGVYVVEVQLDGFSTWRAEGLVLQVGQDRQTRRAAGRRRRPRDDHREPSRARGDDRRRRRPVGATRFETLPLNGRNFLELALLVPGNAPTPIFDPDQDEQRAASSSAGQIGRGSNVTIDGQDNNDDVVGGPLLNLPIDAVQEFQIATNRFGAELGRSASLGHQRRHALGRQHAHGIGVDLRARRRLAGAAGHARQQRPARRRSTGSRCRAPSAARSKPDASSASARASSATRTAPCSSARATPRRRRSRVASRRRRSTTGSGRCASMSAAAASRFMARYAGEQANDTAASARRSRHRIRHAAAGQR